MEPQNASFAIHHTSAKGANSPDRAAYSIELEEAVLGALLMEREALTDVVDILQPSVFYREAHQLIYKAIVALFNKAAPIDPRSVIQQLSKEGTLEKVGGAAAVAALSGSIASAAHIESHARFLLEQATRRKLVRVAAEIQQQAYDSTMDAFVLLDKAEQALFDISDSTIHKGYVEVHTLLNAAVKELEARKESKSGIVGVPSGFVEIDRLLLGWQKSDFVIVAARPGMGKTSFMLNLLRNASVRFQVPAAFFSLEMSSMQLINRMISSEANLPSEKIKRGNLEEYEWQQLYQKTTQLAQSSIYIDDTPALSLFEFRAKCRRLKAQQDIQVVFVDYIQLMVEDANSGKGGANREQQIAAISRGIKAVAKELGITIIVASQLSRSVETRGGDKRPMLSDLRESGAIEQDADVVMFLYRPEYYDITQDEEGRDTRGTAEVIVAKHRNGPTGKVVLQYTAPTTKFSDITSSDRVLESRMNFEEDL